MFYDIGQRYKSRSHAYIQIKRLILNLLVYSPSTEDLQPLPYLTLLAKLW
jgi:hypothetical protein